MHLAEAAARFWAAASYLRRAAPDAPLRGQAYRILRGLALTETGTLQQRALEATEDYNEPTCYHG